MNGTHGDYDTFYRTYHLRVRRFAAATFGGNDAEDIAQDVMFRAFRHLDSLDLDRPIWPWLKTVTRRVGIDLARARHDMAADNATIDALLGPQPDQPALAAELGDARRRLRRALDRLPSRDLEMLESHDIYGTSISDVAKAKGTTDNTVRQQIFRARRRLRKSYLRCGGFSLSIWAAATAVRRLAARRPARLAHALPAVTGTAALLVLTALGGSDRQDLYPDPGPGPSRFAGKPPATAPPGPGPTRLPAERPDQDVGDLPAPLVVAGGVAWEAGSRLAPLRDGVMVYFPPLDRYVLFGGRDTGYSGVTWTSPDGDQWTRHAQDDPAPSPRRGAAMCYDSAHEQLVLHGGHHTVSVHTGTGAVTSTSEYLDDTWLFTRVGDRGVWQKVEDVVPGARPPAREGAAFAPGPDGRCTLFGGYHDAPLSDTWQWDGTSWAELKPTVVPPARYGAAMAYDARVRTTVLFGGHGADGLLGDTWTWDGSGWAPQFPEVAPAPRELAGMVGTDHGPILVGGRLGPANSAETWRWTGETWHLLRPAPDAGLPALCGAAFGYDPGADRLVLVGGDLVARGLRQAVRSATELNPTVYVGRILGEDDPPGDVRVVAAGQAPSPSPSPGPLGPTPAAQDWSRRRAPVVAFPAPVDLPPAAGAAFLRPGGAWSSPAVWCRLPIK